MLEESKFSGALAKLKQRPDSPSATTRSDRPPPEAGLPRGKGRPPGKRSDPDYRPTTVLLRKQTKRTASRLLEDTDAGQDLSELIEQLLAEWIRQQS
jgi:hypothetical protein